MQYSRIVIRNTGKYGFNHVGAVISEISTFFTFALLWKKNVDFSQTKSHSDKPSMQYSRIVCRDIGKYGFNHVGAVISEISTFFTFALLWKKNVDFSQTKSHSDKPSMQYSRIVIRNTGKYGFNHVGAVISEISTFFTFALLWNKKRQFQTN